jgi:hypothetical protein
MPPVAVRTIGRDSLLECDNSWGASSIEEQHKRLGEPANSFRMVSDGGQLLLRGIGRVWSAMQLSQARRNDYPAGVFANRGGAEGVVPRPLILRAAAPEAWRAVP